MSGRIIPINFATPLIADWMTCHAYLNRSVGLLSDWFRDDGCRGASCRSISTVRLVVRIDHMGLRARAKNGR